MLTVLTHHLPEITVAILSLIAVVVSVFKAEAHETEASAAALTELVDASHDMRERLNTLERANHQKDEEITRLHEQIAQIPILRAQVAYLTEELSKVRLRHTDEREQMLATLEAKDREIVRLRQRLAASQIEA